MCQAFPWRPLLIAFLVCLVHRLLQGTQQLGFETCGRLQRLFRRPHGLARLQPRLLPRHRLAPGRRCALLLKYLQGLGRGFRSLGLDAGHRGGHVGCCNSAPRHQCSKDVANDKCRFIHALRLSLFEILGSQPRIFPGFGLRYRIAVVRFLSGVQRGQCTNHGLAEARQGGAEVAAGCAEVLDDVLVLNAPRRHGILSRLQLAAGRLQGPAQPA
mmetsp:Transcript_94639/g.267438  ORF Transcript_94639/g.267438 Transcript_94639/m.267438 type:complete len:214 (+) Transcript_94639:348-989(+)